MSLSIYVLRATHSRRSEPLKLVGYKSHATNTHTATAQPESPLTPTFAFAIIPEG